MLKEEIPVVLETETVAAPAVVPEDELDRPHPELDYLFRPIMESIRDDFTWHFNGVEFYYGPHALDNHKPTNPIVELDETHNFNKLFQLDFKGGEFSRIRWSPKLKYIEPEDFNMYGSSASNSASEYVSSQYLGRINAAIDLLHPDSTFGNINQIIWIKRMVATIVSCDRRDILNHPRQKTIKDLFRWLNFQVYEED